MDLRSLIRVGIVSNRSASRCAVRVVFSDQDELVSDWLPVIVPQTSGNKDFWLPDIDSRVVCLFLGNGLEAGFCIGSYYSGNAPAGATGNKRGIWFSDGSYVEYDGGRFRINAKSKVVITGAAGVEIAGETTISGDVRITGDLTVDGSITRRGESI